VPRSGLAILDGGHWLATGRAGAQPVAVPDVTALSDLTASSRGESVTDPAPSRRRWPHGGLGRAWAQSWPGLKARAGSSPQASGPAGRGGRQATATAFAVAALAKIRPRPHDGDCWLRGEFPQAVPAAGQPGPRGPAGLVT
jgi:hypothetical protein